MERHSRTHMRALSKGQERRAVEFLENSFQDIESAFKKRSDPSLSRLPTLSAYLDAMHPLLAFVLQIPPVDPSASLRTTFLLRLTNDVMTSVPGYPPEMDGLQQLLDFFDDLDEAWLAVLNAQVWDPASGAALDLVVPVEVMGMTTTDRPSMRAATPVSQTERTRLHSLLVTGTAALEAWLSRLPSQTPGEDYQGALERAGLLHAFDALFSHTLAEMGGLSSERSIDLGPSSMGTC